MKWLLFATAAAAAAEAALLVLLVRRARHRARHRAPRRVAAPSADPYGPLTQEHAAEVAAMRANAIRAFDTYRREP